MTDVHAPLSEENQPQPETFSGGVQEKINERIKSLIGYQIANQYLRDFLDEFGDPHQLRCEPTESTKRLYTTKLQNWEELFTDSFYRAARIVALRQQKEHPHFRGVNMETIIPEAEELIQIENAMRESASEDIGYRR